MKNPVYFLFVLTWLIASAQAQENTFNYRRMDSLFAVYERTGGLQPGMDTSLRILIDSQINLHRLRVSPLLDLFEQVDVKKDSVWADTLWGKLWEELGEGYGYHDALMKKNKLWFFVWNWVPTGEMPNRLKTWDWPDSLNAQKLKLLEPLILPYLEEYDRLTAMKFGIMHTYYFNGGPIWIGYGCYEKRYKQLKERYVQISEAFEKSADKLTMPRDSLLLTALVDSLCGVSGSVNFKFDLMMDDVAMIPLQAAQRIVRQKLHTPPPVYTKVLQIMVKLFRNGGTASKLPNNVPTCEEYVDIAKSYRPEDRKVNSDYFETLRYLSRVYYYETFEYQKRVVVLKEVLDLVETQLGKQNYTYTTEACNLAQAWQYVGQIDLADALFREAVAIERTLSARPENKGKEMGSLKKIFDFYFETQQYRKAETIHLEIMEAHRKKDGETSLKYALDLKQLGILYRNDGRYPKADSCYTAAAAIFEKVHGKKDMLYNQMLVIQGEMAARTGDFKNAEALYLQAKASMEELLQGKYDGWVNFGDYNQQTYDYPACLTSLALLYYYIGQYERADELYQTALQIYRTAKPSSKLYLDRKIASLLNNIGVNYWGWEKEEEAEKCFRESLSIYEETDGKEAANYMLSLNSLGDLYFSGGHYDKADSIYQEVIPFWQKSAKSTHRYFLACARQYLAMLYENTGRAAQAEPLFQAAKEDFAISKGKNHPEYAACLFSQGCYLVRQGKTDQAIAALTEANTIEQNLVKSGCTYLSERELQQLADKTRRSAAFIYSWLSKQNGKGNTALGTLCYDNVLFDKGFLLQARLAVDQAVAQADSGTQVLFERWKDLQRHLAVQYTALVRDSAYIAGLEVQAIAMEKELTRLVATLGQAQQQVSWQAVQQKLQPGEATIEFVHFQHVFPKPTDSVLYAALLILPGTDAPRFIPLFEEKQLDSLFGQTSVRKTDYVNNLYAIAERGAKPLGKPQKTLYELIWQLLEKEM
ncbi:MAG: tetratricopeptide repeat protein, partial [Thermoanaerobaculia bacterium]|nr:tetratricopeptide repeat protein [Thermoanaerobaculia bacterium]